MPVSISAYSDKEYIEMQWIGLVTDNEVITEKMKYLGSSRYRPGTHELVDLSGADLS